MPKNSNKGMWTLAPITLAIVMAIAGESKDRNLGKDHAIADDFAVKLEGRKRLNEILRDPGSLELIDEQVLRPGRDGGTVGYSAKYRAKNGFGGYVVDEFYTE